MDKLPFFILVNLMYLSILANVGLLIYLYKIHKAYRAEQQMIRWYQKRLNITPRMVKD